MRNNEKREENNNMTTTTVKEIFKTYESLKKEKEQFLDVMDRYLERYGHGIRILSDKRKYADTITSWFSSAMKRLAELEQSDTDCIPFCETWVQVLKEWNVEMRVKLDSISCV